MTREVLARVWKEVEVAYLNEQINSERALQAVLYKCLSNIFTNDYILLVEPNIAVPNFGNCCPDLVVVDRKNKTSEAIIEIKCAPHWWHHEACIKRDFDKLQAYSLMTEAKYDIFGPDRIFDIKALQWDNGKPLFSVTDQTLLCFADIARKESVVLTKHKIRHTVVKLPNFVLLAGTTDPDNKSAIFSLS